MSSDHNYWTSVFQKRMSRRKALTAAMGAGLGYAGLSFLGCSSGRQQQEQAVVTPITAMAKPPVATGEPKLGGVLKYPGYEGAHWDTNVNTDGYVTRNISRIYSTLTSVFGGPDPTTGETNVSPWLAESWEQPDPATYIFKLRRGVKFHNMPPVNGREMTSEDAKFSYNRVSDKKTGNPETRSRTKYIASVETPDKYTFKVKLDKPVASFLIFAAGVPFFVTPHESVEKYGDLKKAESAIGTGPWMLDKYEPGVGIKYKKNPEFFLPAKPYLDALENPFFRDSASAMAALRTKAVDAHVIPRTELTKMKETNPDVVYDEYFVPQSNRLSFRSDQPPFSDVRVRRALAMAIDWEGYNKTLLLGAGQRVGPLTPVFGKYFLPFEEDPASDQWYKLDIAGSKQLLAEAGYPNGFETKLTTVGANVTSELLAANLAKVGITVKIQPVTDADFFIRAWVGNFEGMALRTTHYIADLDWHLVGMYYPGEPMNHGRINNPELTKLIDKMVGEFNTAERVKLVHDITKIIRDQVYDLQMPMAPSIFAMHPYVKNMLSGWRTFCQGGWDLETVDVWVEK